MGTFQESYGVSCRKCVTDREGKGVELRSEHKISDNYARGVGLQDVTIR